MISKAERKESVGSSHEKTSAGLTLSKIAVFRKKANS